MTFRQCASGRLSCVASGARWLVLMLPLMAGCASTHEWWNNCFKVGPNYCPPGAKVSESWIDASDPHLLGSEDDNACWWTAFGDPTLDQLVAAASQQNLTLKMAAFRILEARAERGIAAGNLFPQQQEATAQYSRNAMSKNAYPFNIIPLPKYYYDNWSAGLDAAW